MRLKHEHRWVELKANTSPTDSPVPLKVWLDNHVKGWYRQFEVSNSLLPIEPSLTEQQQNQLFVILQSFAHLFSEPQGLPQTRSYAHTITLSPNHSPISVRPYRYPHAQKTEIEQQVQ